jgi:hypothetical protein
MKLTRFLAISSLLVLASISMAQTLNIGDKAKALETQKMAVSLAGADKIIQEMKDRLKQFGG